jgi:hypothetical protein
MKRLAWTICSPIAITLALTSCEGSDIGNPRSFELTMYGGETPAIMIDQAWLAVDGITLSSAGDCAGQPVFSVPGPLAIDLLADDPPAALAELPFDAGSHCRLAVTWGVGGGSAPNELQGVSVVVGGARADGTRFLIRSVRTGDLVFGSEATPFDLPVGITTLFLGFDAQAAMSSVDLNAATVGGDGVIRIESGSNETQLAAFETAFHGAAHLFDDVDHDHTLDPTEHDPLHAIASGH